jgi:RNA polymerase sigma-70 factor (ECF subfamily)
MNHFSDEQLAAKSKKGDEVALEVLVKRYLPILFNFSRKYVGNAEAASDITQEVFVKVWKNINKFDDSKKFKTWIFTLAKNTAIDWLREKKALPFSMFEQADGNNFLNDLADNNPSIIEQISQKLIRQQLTIAIEQLPQKYGSIINLHSEGGYTFKEIAWMLEEPLNTVKSRYRRGLSSLKKVLATL